MQIADALYYNPALTLAILQKLGVALEIFNLWFNMLQQVKKSGIRVNFKRYYSFIDKVVLEESYRWDYKTSPAGIKINYENPR